MAGPRFRFAVLGPGGVGGLLAALLARAGDEVSVVAGDDTVRAIAAGGITLESARFGTFTVAVEAAARLTSPVDAVLVTVKATQLREAVVRIPASTLGRGLVIPFLNGIDHVDMLRDVYSHDSVVPGTIRIETIRVGPGRIRHTSPFARVELAPAPSVLERAGGVGEHLRAAGLDVSLREDELAMLWDKVVVLAPMALLTTHARANVGTIRSTRREDLIAVIGELAAVAKAEGAAEDPEAVLRFIDSVPEGMGTSMERDRAAGLPLELDALGGALLRRAARAGVDAPVTTMLVEEISRSA
jgi:2-dehydropantoate 2-reductase